MEVFEHCQKKLRSQQADKYEIYFERSTNLSIEIKANRLDHLSRSSDHGLALRVLKNGRVGFAYTYDLSKEALDKTIHTAMAIAELMPQDEFNDLLLFEASHYPDLHCHDQKGLDITFEEKLELAKKLEADTLKADPRIKRVRKAGFDESNIEVMMMDSSSEIISHKQTVFGFQVLCIAEENGSAETGYESQYSNFMDQLNPREISASASDSSLSLLGAGTCPTMQCPVLFKNSVVAELLGFLSSSFSAENIDKNFSFLVGKKGQNLFSEKITLIDDPLLPASIGSSPFDGEGSPSITKHLIDEGEVSSFLYDSYYARKHGTKNTSNSRRSGIANPPGIGTTNLFLKKGKRKFEQLASEITKGVFITDLMGLHTANPVTGEFSVGASGILIENGKLTTPVKGFAIAGNLIDLLKNTQEVGADLKFWGSVGAPSLLVSKLSVSGS